MKTLVLTHRGLEPAKSSYFSESSYEAFSDQISRGFGLEFDPNYLADGNIVITHDATLKRITQGRDERAVKTLLSEDIKATKLENGRLAFWLELMDLIRQSPVPIHALHCKGMYQTQPYIDTLLKQLEEHEDCIPKLLLFDVREDTARYLKSKRKDLILAPSVAHPYDIQRFNKDGVMFGTLHSLAQALELRELYDWVWLDEWDLQANEAGAKKQLYTAETFSSLRSAGYKIGLVTPELHGTSPGLLGSEAHPDAENREKLFKRIREILELKPEAVCTDYPDEVRQMLA